jgi:vancomycin resistance protein YoaR
MVEISPGISVLKSEQERLPPPDHRPSPELGRYSTEYDVNARATNIELAATKLRTVLDPQQEFSFNDVVGPRVAENGFIDAPVIFMGEMTPGIGGGVCQVSSTLHAAALMSGMEITSRQPHTRMIKYIPKGMDATVAYPVECNGNHRENAHNRKNPNCYSVDLTFKNPYGFGVGIKTEITEVDPGKRMKLTVIFEGAEQVYEKVDYNVLLKGGEEAQRKFHKIGRIKTATYRKLVQSGQGGANVVSIIKYLAKEGTKCGTTHEFRYESKYPPVNEVWEVGFLYDMDGPPPWELH